MPVLKNPKHEAFAQHYANNGNATQSYIDAGYPAKTARQSGSRLLSNVDIQNRIKELQEVISSVSVEASIAERKERVLALQNRWHLMQRVIEERAVDPQMQKAPGGKTGLLTVTYKSQVVVKGKSRKSALVPEYAVDTGLLKELRAHEQQAAQELGQWVEKQAQTDPAGNALPDSQKFAAVSADTILKAIALLTPKSDAA